VNEETLKQLTTILTSHCLKGTVIEELTIDGALTLKKRKQFNKELSDKLYTFLLYFFNKSPDEYSKLVQKMGDQFPSDWELPDIDPEMTKFL